MKIFKLILAIWEYEGWFPPGSENHEAGSRSYRNHNPGNLRASPFEYKNSEGYSVFLSDIQGFMALYWDIMQKARGNTSTGLGPNSTLRDLIYVYAPPQDNNIPEKYLKFVTEKTSFLPTLTLKELFA